MILHEAILLGRDEIARDDKEDYKQQRLYLFIEDNKVFHPR